MHLQLSDLKCDIGFGIDLPLHGLWMYLAVVAVAVEHTVDWQAVAAAVVVQALNHEHAAVENTVGAQAVVVAAVAATEAVAGATVAQARSRSWQLL